MKCWQCGIHFPESEISDPEPDTVYMCSECRASGKILNVEEILALVDMHYVQEDES